jgi:hypothetical protein
MWSAIRGKTLNDTKEDLLMTKATTLDQGIFLFQIEAVSLVLRG